MKGCMMEGCKVGIRNKGLEESNQRRHETTRSRGESITVRTQNISAPKGSRKGVSATIRLSRGVHFPHLGMRMVRWEIDVGHN